MKKAKKYSNPNTRPLDYLYRCVSQGPVNNGLKKDCTFEHTFMEGDHNCPLCGNKLERTTKGLSVSEILRKGQQIETRNKKNEQK